MNDTLHPSSSSTSPESKIPKERDNDATKLPTPPPDPKKGEANQEILDKERELLQYLISLQQRNSQRTFTRSDSIFGPAIAIEEAFNHLEKLYKLMEQLLNLRQQNARLQRRVRDLEYLRNLEKMNRNVEINVERVCLPNVEEETALAENLFDTLLAIGRKDDKLKTWNQSRFRQSLLRKQRGRRISVSIGENKNQQQYDRTRPRRASASYQPSKISKWTKVKAAFKWEKASNNVSNAKSQDSGIGSIHPINCEVARYLRVPSASEEPGTSPGDSGAADGSSPASLSTASSVDNLHEQERKEQPDRRSGDENRRFFCYDNILQNKDDKDNVKRRRHTLSCRSDDIKLDEIVVESSNEDAFEAEENEEDRIPRRVKEKYKEILNDIKNQNSTNKSDTSERVSRWNRIKKAFLNDPVSPDGDPQLSTDEETNVFTFKLDEYSGNSSGVNTLKIQAEIQKNYEQLQKKLSQEFQVKLQEWEKMKSHSPSVYSEEQKDEAFLKKMEEWQRIKSHPSKLQAIEMMKQENLPPDFKKKLQEWQRIKKSSTKEEPMPSSSSNVPSRSKWKPNLLLLPDDATWKQTKQLQDNNCNLTPPISPTKLTKKIKDSTHKEFTWLEKELGKIDKEKQRLEREKQKFMEREQRLTKLGKSVMGNGNKKEIFIHTPSGFHRFEGISKKFTQKLYEWEKSQGIGPESSTIALLSSGLGLTPKSYFIDQQGKPFSTYGGLTLMRSKSDDSLMVNNLNGTISHQPSSLSLNHVEELERECMLPVSESTLDDDVFTNDRNIDEPEAIIVEVEDIVEETASPLEERPKEMLFPVYHRQPDDKIWPCKSHQMAENNTSKYDRITKDISELISEISEIDKKHGEETIEDPLRRGCDNDSLKANNIAKQLSNTEQVLEKLEVLKCVVDDTRTPQGYGFPLKHLTNVEESVQELLKKLTLKVEDLKDELTQKLDALNIQTNRQGQQQKDIPNETSEINNIIGDLKRYMDRMVATSATVKENVNVDDKERQDQVKQGAIKKRFRLKPVVSKNEDATDDSDEDDDRNVHLVRSTHRSRTTADSKSRWKRSKVQDCEKNSNVIPENALVQTTKKLFDPVTDKKIEENVNHSNVNNCSVSSFSYQKRSSNTRRLPPLPSSPNSQRKTPKEISPCIRLMMNRYNQKVSEQDVHSLKSTPSSGSVSPVAWRSPLSEKRVKVQTQRYLMELRKQSTESQVQKSASVGHLRTNDEKKQSQLSQKSEGKISRSVSAGVIQNLHSRVQKSITKGNNEQQEENLREDKKLRPTSLKLNIIPYEEIQSDSRSYRLKKSREDFLASAPIKTAQVSLSVQPDPLSAPVAMETDKTIVYPSRNRLSQVSVESESSCDSSTWHGLLMKSASAGMINIDADSYKQFDAAAFHRDGYVSLPRSPKKTKEDNFLISSKSALANLASKFRKVKMRRHNKDPKNKKNMNTITALCRQSLVVDINSETSSQSNSEQSSRKNSVLAGNPGERNESGAAGSSCPSEETLLNTSSKERWTMKRPKIFTKYNQ
ncbi:uncharacterized protein LOC108735698 [Agrilus planipennis]|uniref:Uncharacterized protein LOC108735698 n=1 Tax=Agrilus planipennis TaxID=224129 RepID=A0A1W4WH56_AGRPL|nr:uncharacterized protein LOC108735698 [Agrilus planipennis]